MALSSASDGIVAFPNGTRSTMLPRTDGFVRTHNVSRRPFFVRARA
ncbi:MAG TPA: hypothetical protein VFT14_00270 [Solirubrobacterales bacterium]|nr:hypothetical protein [Solirubrobacterales bacterium]